MVYFNDILCTVIKKDNEMLIPRSPFRVAFCVLLFVAILFSIILQPIQSLSKSRASLRSESRIRISVGYSYSCAVLNDGSIKCWGSNSSGELGLGDTTSRGTSSDEMGGNLPVIDLGTASDGTKLTAKSLSAGDSHTCAILNDDSLKCWGRNTSGQLGIGDAQNRGDAPNEMGNKLPKVNLGTGKTAKFVSAGTSHTCAILNDDTLKCWGDNSHGQLGYGNNTALPAPIIATVPFAPGRSVQQISAGIAHTCAILDNDTVHCWGKNSKGQLGMEHTDTLTAPFVNAVNLGTGRTAVQISSRGDHSCAVLDNNTAKCWGDNYKGQLGQNDAKSEMSAIGIAPNQMGDNLSPIELGTDRTALSIETSNLAEVGDQLYGHTCVILDNSSIKCWGANSLFQLGLGVINMTSIGDAVGEIASLAAISLGTGQIVTDVSLGAAHVCAVLGEYTVKCWGWGALGQLGNGSWINRGSCCMGDSLPVANLNDPLAQTATAIVELTALANMAQTATAAKAQTSTAISVSKSETAAPGLTAKAAAEQTKVAAAQTVAVAKAQTSTAVAVSKAQTAAPGLTAKAAAAQTKVAIAQTVAVAKAQTSTAVAVSKAQTAAPGLTAKAAVAQTKAALAEFVAQTKTAVAQTVVAAKTSIAKTRTAAAP